MGVRRIALCVTRDYRSGQEIRGELNNNLRIQDEDTVCFALSLCSTNTPVTQLLGQFRAVAQPIVRSASEQVYCVVGQSVGSTDRVHMVEQQH